MWLQRLRQPCSWHFVWTVTLARCSSVPEGVKMAMAQSNVHADKYCRQTYKNTNDMELAQYAHRVRQVFTSRPQSRYGQEPQEPAQPQQQQSGAAGFPPRMTPMDDGRGGTMFVPLWGQQPWLQQQPSQQPQPSQQSQPSQPAQSSQQGQQQGQGQRRNHWQNQGQNQGQNDSQQFPRHRSPKTSTRLTSMPAVAPQMK